MRIWVLVGDSSRARVLNYDTDGKKWEVVKELEHPQSRLKGTDLTTDAPGRQRQSFGHGRPAMEMPTDPKDVEKERFVRQVIDELQHGHDERSYDALVLVAPPHTLGLLRGSLSPVLNKSVILDLDKDYAPLGLPVLIARLQPVMDELKDVEGGAT